MNGGAQNGRKGDGMKNLFDIQGCRAIVTGGTRGLGHGMAEGLMEAGASVVIFGTSSKVEQVAADFRAKEKPEKVRLYRAFWRPRRDSNARPFA